MSTNTFAQFKAASVQAAPVFLDAMATAEKAANYIAEAASNGAKLVVFPEVFIPGYPYWNWFTDPVSGSAWFEKLVKASVFISGPEIQTVCNAAATNETYVVIGINERSSHSVGSLYNTLVFIDSKGKIIGKHRKLVPTWAEKLTWAGGDGSSIKVYDTDIGPLGGLACGENTNPLARFSLLAQGELVHTASYISLPVAPADYNMAEAIKLRSQTHSFEGKVYTITSTSTISDEIITEMEKVKPGVEAQMRRASSAYSGIIGPDGRAIAEIVDDEGIVYADIDLSKCIQPRQMHDITGHYNRFDVFQLTLNQAEKQAIYKQSATAQVQPQAPNSELEALSIVNNQQQGE